MVRGFNIFPMIGEYVSLVLVVQSVSSSVRHSMYTRYMESRER